MPFYPPSKTFTLRAATELYDIFHIDGTMCVNCIILCSDKIERVVSSLLCCRTAGARSNRLQELHELRRLHTAMLEYATIEYPWAMQCPLDKTVNHHVK